MVIIVQSVYAIAVPYLKRDVHKTVLKILFQL